MSILSNIGALLGPQIAAAMGGPASMDSVRAALMASRPGYNWSVQSVPQYVGGQLANSLGSWSNDPINSTPPQWAIDTGLAAAKYDHESGQVIGYGPAGAGQETYQPPSAGSVYDAVVGSGKYGVDPNQFFADMSKGVGPNAFYRVNDQGVPDQAGNWAASLVPQKEEDFWSPMAKFAAAVMAGNSLGNAFNNLFPQSNLANILGTPSPFTAPAGGMTSGGVGVPTMGDLIGGAAGQAVGGSASVPMLNQLISGAAAGALGTAAGMQSTGLPWLDAMLSGSTAGMPAGGPWAGNLSQNANLANLIANNEGMFANLGQQLSQNTGQLTDAFGNQIANLNTSLGGGLQNLSGQLGTTNQQLANLLASNEGMFADLAQQNATQLGQLTDSFGNQIGNLGTSLGGGLQNLSNQFGNWGSTLTNQLGNIGSQIQAGQQSMADLFGDVASGWENALAQSAAQNATLSSGLTGILGGFGDIIKSIPSGIGSAISGLGGLFGDALGSFGNAINSSNAAMSGLLGPLIGGLLGAIDKPKEGKTTTVQDLPDWQKPFVVDAMNRAQGLFGQNNPDPALSNAASNALGSTIGGNFLTANPAFGAMQGWMNNPGVNPSQTMFNTLYGGAQNNPGNQTFSNIAGGVTNPATGMLMDTAQGKFLNANPHLDAMFDKAAGKTRAGVDSMFAGAGRYGSGAHQGLMFDKLGELATDIYGGNYAQERQNMLGAQRSIGDLANTGISQQLQGASGLSSNFLGGLGNQLQAASGVGGAYTGDRNFGMQAATGLGGLFGQERSLQQQGILGAPQFSAQAYQVPWLGAKNYMDLVGGNFGRSTTSPYFTSPIGNIMSGALGGQQLFKGIFGGP